MTTDNDLIQAALDYHWVTFPGEEHPAMTRDEASCRFDEVAESYRRERGMLPGAVPLLVEDFAPAKRPTRPLMDRFEWNMWLGCLAVAVAYFGYWAVALDWTITAPDWFAWLGIPAGVAIVMAFYIPLSAPRAPTRYHLGDTGISYPIRRTDRPTGGRP